MDRRVRACRVSLSSLRWSIVLLVSKRFVFRRHIQNRLWSSCTWQSVTCCAMRCTVSQWRVPSGEKRAAWDAMVQRLNLSDGCTLRIEVVLPVDIVLHVHYLHNTAGWQAVWSNAVNQGFKFVGCSAPFGFQTCYYFIINYLLSTRFKSMSDRLKAWSVRSNNKKHIDLFVFSNLCSRWTHPKPENPRGAVTLMLGPMDRT